MIIKTIRNAFAHGLHGLSFESPEVSEECVKLRVFLSGLEKVLSTPRVVFLSATLSAFTELWTWKGAVEYGQLRCKVPDMKAMALYWPDAIKPSEPKHG
jgi:hypothetical protein